MRVILVQTFLIFSQVHVHRIVLTLTADNMSLELVENLPTLEDFTPLSEHQQQTPGSFFGGKPVLYLRCPISSVRISRDDLELQPVIANLRHEELSSENEEQVTFEGIDVWVSSRSANNIRNFCNNALTLIRATSRSFRR